VLAGLIAPATAGFDPSTVTGYDIDNGTFLKYWVNKTSGGLDLFGFGYSLTLPFIMTMGWYWYGILFFVYLGGVYMRGGEISLPLTIGLAAATMWGAVMPPEMNYVSSILFGVGLAGMMIKWLIDNIGR